MIQIKSIDISTYKFEFAQDRKTFHKNNFNNLELFFKI